MPDFLREHSVPVVFSVLLHGAIIAALVMLVITDVTAVVISPVWASFVFFVILVAVLLVRPQGLFGVRVRDRL